MAAKKPQTSPAKIEILTRLETPDHFSEVIRQFDEAFVGMRSRKEFLGMSVASEAGQMAIKITVTQLGELKFTEEMNLPKEFEAKFTGARAMLKVSVKSAPIVTSAAPKSAAGKKTAPVFPVKSS